MHGYMTILSKTISFQTGYVSYSLKAYILWFVIWLCLLSCCRSKTFDPSFLSHVQSDIESKSERKKQQCYHVSDDVSKLWWHFEKQIYLLLVVFVKYVLLVELFRFSVFIWCFSFLEQIISTTKFSKTLVRLSCSSKVSKHLQW